MKTYKKQPVGRAGSGSAVIAKLEEIDGLDADSAVERMGGRQDVYVKAVDLTARLLPEKIDNLNVFLSEKELIKFAGLVHGVKGVLRNIGASALGDKAGLLEMAAKDGNTGYCVANYPDFKDAAVRFIEKMNAALAAEAPVEKKRMDKKNLSTTLNRAKLAAKTFDAMGALEIIGRLSGLTYNRETDELLEEVVLSLEKFNCTGALSSIMKLEELLDEH